MNLREIENVYEVCDIWAGFDDIVKAKKHILFILRANGMISWTVINLISMEEPMLFLKYIKDFL